MSNVIDLNRRSKVKSKKQPPVSEENEQRLERIKQSLSKINQLMDELRCMGLNTDSINESK